MAARFPVISQVFQIALAGVSVSVPLLFFWSNVCYSSRHHFFFLSLFLSFQQVRILSVTMAMRQGIKVREI